MLNTQPRFSFDELRDCYPGSLESFLNREWDYVYCSECGGIGGYLETITTKQTPDREVKVEKFKICEACKGLGVEKT